MFGEWMVFFILCEKEVLEGIFEGKLIKVIVDELGIS